MSRLCSCANFTKVKLCTMLDVIGKSEIFPITSKYLFNKSLRIINIIIKIYVNIIMQNKILKSQKLTLNKEIIQTMTLLNYMQMQIC